jgi:hypothetical protein
MSETGTNPDRGEVAITLGGKSYVMRPGFDAMRKLEAMAGKSVVKILGRFQDQDFSIIDVAAVITAGINANRDNERVTFEQVGELIANEGMLLALNPAAQFIGIVVTAGPKKGN